MRFFTCVLCSPWCMGIRMSLQDDLTRNRRIFELLTGERPGQDAPYHPLIKSSGDWNIAQPVQNGNGFSLTPPEGASETLSTPAGHASHAESSAVVQTARARGFSLTYGAVDLPVGFDNLPAVGSVTYPAIGHEATRIAPERADPLEAERSRIERQARMASQLSREEGFFGF